MLVLSTVSFLVGTVLARRFNVVVLIPAVAIVLALALGIGISNAFSAWSIVAMAVAATTSLQIGYLIGLSIHDLLAAASSRRAPATSARHPAR